MWSLVDMRAYHASITGETMVHEFLVVYHDDSRYGFETTLIDVTVGQGDLRYVIPASSAPSLDALREIMMGETEEHMVAAWQLLESIK